MISVLVPTHRRPQLAKRMLDSILEMTSESVEVFFYVDEDDPTIEEYRELLGEEGVYHFHPDALVASHSWISGSSKKVGEIWNVLAKESSGSWIMMGNDDLVFRTPGWDVKIEEALKGHFPKNLGVAYVNDGGPKADTQCAFPIVSREWYTLLGYFTPERFHFLWNDTWIRDVASMAGCLHYIPDVLVEHCHFSFGKAERDVTYMKHRTGEAIAKRKEDEEVYQNTKHLRELDADTVMKTLAL